MDSKTTAIQQDFQITKADAQQDQDKGAANTEDTRVILTREVSQDISTSISDLKRGIDIKTQRIASLQAEIDDSNSKIASISSTLGLS